MSDAPAPPSLPGLFFGFFTVGMCGFGGVLPWARRMVVERRRWMTSGEFTDLLSLCQFLPGGNILNLVIAVGARFHGAIGAVVAFVGLMAAPMMIVLLLGVVYREFGGLPAVHAAFDGLAAAAAALVLATALKIAAPLRNRPLGIAIAMVTFVAIALLRLPLPAVMGVVAPLSIVISYRFRT